MQYTKIWIYPLPLYYPCRVCVHCWNILGFMSVSMFSPMPWKILATARPENFSSLRLARKLLTSALIWSSQSSSCETQTHKRNVISRPAQRTCSWQLWLLHVLPCIAQTPLRPPVRVGGSCLVFCQSTPTEEFSDESCDCRPNHQRTMTQSETQHCKVIVNYCQQDTNIQFETIRHFYDFSGQGLKCVEGLIHK